MRTITLTDSRGTRWLVDVAERRRERMRGLLGRDHLPPGRAMLLPGARSVHTFGMRFPIRAAFVRGDPDHRLLVLAVVGLRPRRLTRPRLRAHHVMEVGPQATLERGDVLTAGLN